MTCKVWSTRSCYRRKGPKQVRARFVVRQFANSLDANFHSPTLGLEVTRVSLAMALSKDLTILFSDISAAFVNTPMPEGDPVYVEPPEGLYEHNDTVWCLNRAFERFEGRFSTLPRTLRCRARIATWFHTIRSTANAFRGSCA